MTDPSASSVVNSLLEEFGDNAAYALELYARYRLEPASVEENWKRAFQELEERVPHAMAGTEALRSAAAPLLPPAPAPVPAAVPSLPSARPAAPAARPGEIAVAIAGGAATIARNMEASLGVPTATTNRVIPVKTMEENRRILNRHREALGLSKVSFTHFVAWAIVRALEKHPTMNDAFGEVDGKPARIRKPVVNLGIAIDITKKDGTRSLLVDEGQRTFQQPHHGCCGQRFLGGEVLVQAGLGDADVGGHFVHRHQVETLVGKQVDHGRHDRVLAHAMHLFLQWDPCHERILERFRLKLKLLCKNID